MVSQASSAIDHVMEVVSASNLIVRPITNWYDQFLNWNATAAGIIKPCLHTTCTDCVLPLNTSYTFAQQVCFFLYAIPLNSKCCQVRCCVCVLFLHVCVSACVCVFVLVV